MLFHLAVLLMPVLDGGEECTVLYLSVLLLPLNAPSPCPCDAAAVCMFNVSWCYCCIFQ